MKTIFIVFLAITSSTYAQESKISGVVTYFFNDNYGNKPDVGSSVYIIDSASAPFISIPAYDSLIKGKHFASFCRKCERLLNTQQATLKILKHYPRYYKKEISRLNTEIDSIKSEQKKYSDSAVTYGSYCITAVSSQLDSKIFEMKMKINSDNATHRTVDGVGNYSANLSPGTYFIYMESKNRKGDGISESNGLVYFTKAVLKTNSVKDVSHNFELGTKRYK